MQGREENIFKGAGEGFQQCYVLKIFPSTLKNEGEGRKKRKGKKKRCKWEEKDAQGRENNIFKSAGEDFH